MLMLSKYFWKSEYDTFTHVNLMLTYLVTVLILSVVLTLLLYCIIRQVDHSIVCVLNVVLFTTCAEVALGVKISLKVTISGGSHGIDSDVKLAALVEQRLLEVFLNDVGSLAAVDQSRIYDRPNLIQIATHLDATTTVCVLARLDNPEAVAEVGILCEHWVAVGVGKAVLESLKLFV